MDCSLQGSPVQKIPQEWILEWVAISFTRGSSWARDQTLLSCIAGRFFTIWAIREAPYVLWWNINSNSGWWLCDCKLSKMLLVNISSHSQFFPLPSPKSRMPQIRANWDPSYMSRSEGSWYIHQKRRNEAYIPKDPTILVVQVVGKHTE